jgi:hypothetical protein
MQDHIASDSLNFESASGCGPLQSAQPDGRVQAINQGVIMKAANVVRSIMVPALLVAVSAWADPSSVSASGDAHARAAALLSGATSNVVVRNVPVRSLTRASADGQAQAAALLRRPDTAANEAVSQVSDSSARALADAHTQAAALLSRPRTI